VIAVVEPPTPRAAYRLPILTKFPVILGAREVLPALEQVQVDRQSLVMEAVSLVNGLTVRCAIMRLRPCVAECQLVPRTIGENNKIRDHPGKFALLLPYSQVS